MNGAAIPPPGVAFSARLPNANAGAVNSKAASEVNSLRIAVVAEKLAMYAQTRQSFDVAYFFNLCFSLSRGIDYAIANNEKPTQVMELPRIFKLVCQRRSEYSLQAAIMVLMASVKNACKALWFSAMDSQELLTLADEVGRIFCTPEGFSCEQTDVIPIVSQIISRYYPRIKLGHVLASVDIKPGYEACVVDFHLSKNISYLPMERIQLLVAMKDNIDTSSCIINPPKVNILLNGKGLPGRIIGCMNLGPQLPTIVNPLLKYGTNLVQAIGQFDAHYIVLIAFMSVIPSSDLPVPDDYVQPAGHAVDADAEIVEGPSRISLNCPISFTRIKMPVKGHLCKHLQCFDLSNYIEINSKRPSWRCPHCNQSVCFPDIRVDQKMSKILQEVAEGVVNVIICSDGSWEAVSGSNSHKHELPAKASEGLLEGPEQQEASGLCTCNIYDLTEGDNDMVLEGGVPEDRKPDAQPNPLNKSVYINHSVPSVAGVPSEVNQNPATQVQGVSSSGPSGTFSVQADYITRADSEPVGGISPRMFGHFTRSPVLTDSVSPLANREQQAILGTNRQPSSLTVHPPATNSLQLQQLQRAQVISRESGGCAIPRNVSRIPTATQAHPVQMPRPSPLLLSRPFIDNSSGNTSPLPRSPAPVNASTTQSDTVQQYISQSQLQQRSTAQVRGLNPPVPAPDNASSTSRLQTTNRPQPTMEIPQILHRPPHLRLRLRDPPTESPSNTSQTATTGQHYQRIAAAQQAALRTRQPPTTPIQIQASQTSPASFPRPVDGIRNISAERLPSSGPRGMPQTVSRTEDLLDVQSEQNWQPTGRMRGSLSGRPFSDALNQLVIRPTQTTLAPPGQPPSQGDMSPQLQALLANRSPSAAQPNVPRNNS